MAISGTYASPVMVNGYSCRNCAEVAKAEHGVDPTDLMGSKRAADDADRAGETRDRFSPDARDSARLAELHRREVERVEARQASAALAAYGAQPSPSGQFVHLAG